MFSARQTQRWFLRPRRAVSTSPSIRQEQLSITSTKQGELSPYSSIPGPPGLPLFGTALHYMVGWQGLSFDKMFEAYKKRYEKYGPIYKEDYGPHSILVITDYKEYMKVMRADGKQPRRIPLEPLLTYRLRHGLDTGMVNGNGEKWYKYRTAINKKMMRPKEVVEFLEPMDEVAHDLISTIELKRDQQNVVSDVNSILFRWSMESVNTFLLDTRLGTLDAVQSERAETVVHNIVGVFQGMQKLMFDLPLYKVIKTPMWRRFERHCDKAISVGLDIVNQRVEELNNSEFDSTKKQSLVSYLLAEKGLSSFEISAMLVELMVGSVETTSNSMMWCLYLLAENPHCQQLLYNEVRSLLEPGAAVTADTLNNLRYLKACIKESMRLYPVTFATSRILNTDIELFGYHIPADTHVQANTCALCRDPKVFPEPDQFRPERWLSRDGSEEMGVTNLVWGHGARMCIGRRVAEQEMYLGLARIIERYHIFYPEHQAPDPVLHTVMTTRQPMPLKFTDRSSL